jgi:hypothetical protein
MHKEEAMQIESHEWRALINEAAYGLIREQAPNEIPLYVSTRDRYFADPEAFTERVAPSDEPLGAGELEALQNFSQTVFPLLAPALGAMLTAIGAALQERATEKLVAMARKLFAKPEPILTQEQLEKVAAEVRAAIRAERDRLGLDSERSRDVENAIIARLALAKKA